MNEACIIGVDPGLSGALAVYYPTRPALIAVADLPVAGGEIDAAELARMVRRWSPTFAVVESVAAMPKQGVASTFRFGCAFGMVRAALAVAGVPTHLVAPTRWKRHFRLTADKEAARGLAVRLWPASEHFGRKKDHNRAEAALLARFGAETLFAARAA